MVREWVGMSPLAVEFLLWELERLACFILESLALFAIVFALLSLVRGARHSHRCTRSVNHEDIDEDVG